MGSAPGIAFITFIVPYHQKADLSLTFFVTSEAPDVLRLRVHLVTRT